MMMDQTVKKEVLLLGSKTKIFYSIFFGILANFSFSQNSDAYSFASLEKLFKTSQYDSIIVLDEAQLIRNNNSKEGEILFMLAETYENLNSEDKAFDYYKKSKDYYQDKNNKDKVAFLNSKIYFLLDSQNNLDIDKSPYLEDLKNHAFTTDSPKWKMTYYNLKGIDNFKPETKDSAKFYFLKAKHNAMNIDSIRALYGFNMNLGALNLSYFNQPDSAIYYYKEALKLYELDKDPGKKINRLFALYNNLGNVYREQEKYQEALDYYQKAEGIDLKRQNKKSKRILYNNMDVNYYYMNDFKNAYLYLYKYDSINEIIKTEEQNLNIKDIEEKYNNEKLRADNLEIETKRQQNRNIALVLGGAILSGSIIVFLIFKNRKRKQEILKQKQEVKNQKLFNQLKEQELISIDALIEGQEKERLRIANDLHDDLGSLMATIKLHFSTLKDSQTSEELYEKTSTLFDEAYQKIRTIAHAKNSGVLMKQGLGKALKKLAEKVSNDKKLKIKVNDFDFKLRLENSVELTLFRIIQELVSNAIRHGQASGIDIHITTHDNHINIMVEDNGKGFNPRQVTKNNPGMGLSNIDKRISFLDGKMVIESEKNSGTSVIINLPL